MHRYCNSAYWSNSYSEASKGIWPHEHAIAQGAVLYRFIDLTKTPSINGADGPWWFEFEYFQNIKHFAERYGYNLGYCARMFAAILYEWSEVNAVVRARVAHGPVKVWKGKGKPVEAHRSDPRDVATQHGSMTSSEPEISRKMTPMQGPLEVLQIHIPGLGKPHYKFGSIMKFLDSEQIRTG